MESSPILLSITLLSLIISSFAQLEDVFPSSIPVASSATSFPSPAPSPGPATPIAGPTPIDTDSSIEKWCNSTDYPDLCIAAIAPFLKGKPELYSVVCIAIKSTIEATKTAILAGQKLANLPITPSEVKSILIDAVSSFEDAIDNFKQAQDALPQRDWGTVNTMLSGAMTDFGDCEDMLGDQNVPVLMDFSEKLTKMTSNCLALSALFDPQPGY